MKYFSSKMAGEQLRVTSRQVRLLAEKYEWFGEKKGRNWKFTQEMIDRMKGTDRHPGRTKKDGMA